MLTKTDCLSDKWNPQSSAINLEDVHLRDAVFYGMQLYAKDLCIEFDEWKLSEGYKPINWMGTKYWTKDWSIKNYKTSIELFELFLQSINQK